MRQGQQNRRGRGRNNNNNNNNQNRKGQNPLTRSFESTGPDVKIRGTPAHIAEKYMTLARDAQSSGDPVLAENYLQHAEHYNRIIMAFREQQIAQGGGDIQNGMGRPRPGGFGDPMSMSDDYPDDDGDDMGGEPIHSVPQQQPQYSRGNDMQPRPPEGQRFDDRGPRHGGHEQHRQPHHRERQGGGEHRGFSDRHDRQDRPDRPDRPERFQRPERVQQSEPSAEGGPPNPRRNDRVVSHHEQPEFLRRPVRRPRREGNGVPSEEPGPVPTTAAEDTD